MSTAAPPVAERIEWRGEDVEAEELAGRLLRMNREHARNGRGHAATRTLNLLVAPGADVAPETLRARRDELRTRHPSRTVVVREHALPRLDATLTIECSICTASGGAGFCHDAAVLRADAERLAHADSLVHPLQVKGLPTVLWLPGAEPSPAEEPLAGLAEAVVLDSGVAGADAPGAFARATRLLAVACVRDLAWLRLARWRQRIAGRFDDPEARALLSRVERVELSCAGEDAAMPLLLAGWLAARAGWTLAGLARDEDGWHGTARRADGGAVAIAVGGCRGATRRPGGDATAAAVGDPAEPAIAPAAIRALALHVGEASIEIVEPVAEPGDARTFAAALRTFDEPSPGYAPALAALAEGLGAR